MKERKYFWCAKCYKKKPMAELRDELGNRKLCLGCVNEGYFLKTGIVVDREKR